MDKKSPAELEKEKTKAERSQDVAYTTNHAIVCTITDPITDIFFSHYIQKKLGNKSQLKNITFAEVIGDFGAIPATIATQRLFPGAMAAIGKFAEPLFKKGFKNGAKRDAESWAIRHGFEVGGEEYKKRADQYYNYELSHMPQALMWTASSVAMNIGAQKALGNKAPLSHITAGKVGGAILTTGITLGARIAFPRKAEKFDKFTSEHLFIPLQDGVEKMVGSEDKAEKDWSERIKPAREREASAPIIAH